MENCVCYGKLPHRKKIDFQIDENVKKKKEKADYISSN